MNMPMGELLALSAAVLWSFGATLFGLAGRRSNPRRETGEKTGQTQG